MYKPTSKLGRLAAGKTKASGRQKVPETKVSSSATNKKKVVPPKPQVPKKATTTRGVAKNTKITDIETPEAGVDFSTMVHPRSERKVRFAVVV